MTPLPPQGHTPRLVCVLWGGRVQYRTRLWRGETQTAPSRGREHCTKLWQQKDSDHGCSVCVTVAEETHGAFKSQPRSRNQSPSPLGWSQQAPASTKATGSKQQGASSSQRGSSKAAAVSESPEFDSPQFGGAETHTGFEDVDARAAVLAPFGPTGNSSQPSSQGGWAAVAAGRHRPKQQQVPAAAPAAVPAALPAAVPAGTAAAHHVRPGGASRPGAATCRLFQIRGFCPQGASCPFDHPSSNSSEQAALLSSCGSALLPQHCLALGLFWGRGGGVSRVAAAFPRSMLPPACAAVCRGMHCCRCSPCCSCRTAG